RRSMGRRSSRRRPEVGVAGEGDGPGKEGEHGVVAPEADPDPGRSEVGGAAWARGATFGGGDEDPGSGGELVSDVAVEAGRFQHVDHDSIRGGPSPGELALRR